MPHPLPHIVPGPNPATGTPYVAVIVVEGLLHLQFLIACSMQKSFAYWKHGRPGNEAKLRSWAQLALRQRRQLPPHLSEQWGHFAEHIAVGVGNFPALTRLCMCNLDS